MGYALGHFEGVIPLIQGLEDGFKKTPRSARQTHWKEPHNKKKDRGRHFEMNKIYVKFLEVFDLLIYFPVTSFTLKIDR